MGEDERREKAAYLRRVLERYRGGKFETGSSGGAGGMVFFRDARGALFYIGGFNTDDAHRIVQALNLVLQLIESRVDEGTCRRVDEPHRRTASSRQLDDLTT